MSAAPRSRVKLLGNQLRISFMAARPWPRNPGCPISLREMQKRTDEELIETMTKGENKMPSCAETLKESQIKEFVARMGEPGAKK